jgi:hypothetical protein
VRLVLGLPLIILLPSAGQSHRCRGVFNCFQFGQLDLSTHITVECVSQNCTRPAANADITLDSLVGTRSESRSVTPRALTLRATVNTLLIASVLFTTCLTKRPTVPSKCVIVHLWIFLGYTPQEDKHFPTLSLPSLSARLHRYLTPPVSPPARTVRHTRVLRFSPTSPHSPPLLPLPLRQAPEQAKIAGPVRAVLHLHLLPDLTARELLRSHFSLPSLALHFLLHSLPRCLFLVTIFCKIGPFWCGYARCLAKLDAH